MLRTCMIYSYLYDVCLSVWYFPTLVMSGCLCNVFSTVRCLLTSTMSAYIYICLPVKCRLNCMFSTYLFTVMTAYLCYVRMSAFLYIKYLATCTIWCLATQMMSAYLFYVWFSVPMMSVYLYEWCLGTYVISACMMSAFLHNVCGRGGCLPAPFLPVF
jgi:hypothetical protein